MGRDLRKVIADKSADLREVDIHNSNMAQGYRNRAFSGVKSICPIVSSPKDAGKYPTWGPAPYVPIDKLRVTMGSNRVRIDRTVAAGQYNIDRYEVEVPMYTWELDEIIEANRAQFEEQKAQTGSDVCQLGMEVAISTAMQDVTRYDSSMVRVYSSSATQWSDTINSTPIEDLRAAIHVARHALNVDKEELWLWLAYGPDEAIADHPKVQTRASGATGNDLSHKRLGEILQIKGCESLLGSYSVKVDDKNPDAITNVSADLWHDCVLIGIKSEAPKPGEPLPGAIVRREGFPFVDEYVDERVAGTPLVKVTHDAWSFTQFSNKRLYVMKNVSGKTV